MNVAKQGRWGYVFHGCEWKCDVRGGKGWWLRGNPWDAPEISSHTAIAEAQAGAGWVESRGQGLHDRTTHRPSDTALCSHPPPHASYPVPAVQHHRYWHQCPARLAALCPDALPLPVLGCSSGLSRAMQEHYFRERPAELALAMQASSGLLPTHAASAAVHYAASWGVTAHPTVSLLPCLADGGSTAAPVSVVSTTTPRLTPLQSAGGKPVSALTSALSGPVPAQQGEAAAGEGAVEALPEAAMPRVVYTADCQNLTHQVNDLCKPCSPAVQYKPLSALALRARPAGVQRRLARVPRWHVLQHGPRAPRLGAAVWLFDIGGLWA
ncbi:hypothetical protein HaLaN_15054 [Haematococcus lacustris]|uniref:Uncharacterized protein n=1 Tax=Haematococcus lacustris TaxID=44745 RepID=A0A699ZA44_HAELA|nr:hypothetical protein HaLaN_15054 [Haematococcus lacustris]